MTPRLLLQPLVITTLCVTFSAVACMRDDPPTAGVADSPVIADERLETYIRARYHGEPQVRAHDIDVIAADGVVTLRGTVPTAEARQQAATLAQQVSGVRAVENELKVRSAADAAPATTDTAANRDASARAVERRAPGWIASAPVDDQRSPGWITTKIQAQYFVDPEIKPWNIDVTTNSAGVVTLRGEVEEAADRDEAARIARDTEGVSRVDNQLRVKGEAQTGADTTGADTQTADGWITAKVQAKFFVDPDVKGRNVDVETQNGVVTLQGDVETEAERRQAVAIARSTDGVQSVVDQLQVRSDATPMRSPDASASIDDAWITTKIQSQYFLDQLVRARNIDVDTRRGVVTLTGSVASKAEREAATAIARETDGVTRVIDRLTLSTAEPSR